MRDFLDNLCDQELQLKHTYALLSYFLYIWCVEKEWFWKLEELEL